MEIIKDFIRMIFGMEEEATISNAYVFFVLGALAFIGLILSISFY